MSWLALTAFEENRWGVVQFCFTGSKEFILLLLLFLLLLLLVLLLLMTIFLQLFVTTVADDKVEEIVAMVHLHFVGNTVNPVKEKVVGVVSKEKVAVTVVAYC